MIGFTDSDWASDSIKNKSTSGFVFMLGSRPICWSSKKQATLSVSSVEVEYWGDVNASIQKFLLHGILTEFGIHTSPSIYLFCDNHSAIKISNDPVQKQWTKHIEFHMHYIQELVHSKVIILH